ncbi:MAG: amino acid permease [Bryobacterales bacterium]|nr:amino acid permease [Bryobacteraceae bacterium]MDW8355553.1 amino acid permease [Bryobacterales bacterium]
MAAAELARRLGLLDATALVVGVVVGAGIFLTPGVVAGHLAAPGWILAVWALTGLFTLAGALAFAELGAMLPATGGQYVFLREAYGPLVAFLCGWAFLVVIWTGTLAALAVAFAEHLVHVVPISPDGRTLVTVAALVMFTALNYYGVRPGAWTQNLLTTGKLALIVALAMAAWWGLPAADGPQTEAPWSWRGLMLALVACSWTYDGWQALSFVSGEIRRPSRAIPRALLLGLGLVTALYLAVNAAFLPALQRPSGNGAERAILSAAASFLGPGAGAFVSAAILISIAGALNGGILACPRIYFAQARDGLFLRRFGEIHPRFQTPSFSLLFQGVWAGVLAVSGTFETLLTYTMFGNWIFTGLAVGAVMALRRKRPDLDRPYRTWGYPVTPLIYCALSLGLVAGTIAAQPKPSLAGAALILSGVPVYFLWRRRPHGPSAERRA